MGSTIIRYARQCQDITESSRGATEKIRNASMTKRRFASCRMLMHSEGNTWRNQTIDRCVLLIICLSTTWFPFCWMCKTSLTNLHNLLEFSLPDPRNTKSVVLNIHNFHIYFLLQFTETQVNHRVRKDRKYRITLCCSLILTFIEFITWHCGKDPPVISHFKGQSFSGWRCVRSKAPSSATV